MREKLMPANSTIIDYLKKEKSKSLIPIVFKIIDSNQRNATIKP